jgi:hypothetical protein
MFVRKLTSLFATTAAAAASVIRSSAGNRLIANHSLIYRQMPQILISKATIMTDQKPPGPRITVDKDELKKRLTPEQFHVTQEQGTEAPWTGMSS